MKYALVTYGTEEEAILEVKRLLVDGYSAYRQGTTVFIDDGGIDEGY